MHHRVARADPRPVLVADDPGPVLVAEHQVVELRQEAHRRLLVAAGHRQVRQVEQLLPALVAVDPQPVPLPLDLVAEPLHPRPVLQVRDARRAARREVPRQQRPHRRALLQRAAQPVLGERAGHVPAPAPDPGRRRVRSGPPGTARPTPARCPSGRGTARRAAWPASGGSWSGRAGCPGRPRRVSARSSPANSLGERGQPAGAHPLPAAGAQPAVVRAGGEVLGAAQQPAAHDPPVGQRRGQIARAAVRRILVHSPT